MSNNFTKFHKEEKEISSNDVISEIESSSGTHVPLSEVALEKEGEEENLLSQSWSSTDNKIKKPTDQFSPFSGTSGKSANEESGSDKIAGGGKEESENTKASGDNTDTRNRIDAAIESEPKKSVNPRIVKVALGIAAVVVVGAILMLGMKGEKRKSMFAKDKDGGATSGTTNADGTTTTTDTQNSNGGERRTGGLKFGDVAVGSDPKSQSGGKREDITPESTEEAKNTENLDPAASVSPTPITPFMPSYSGYSSSPNGSGNQNPTGGGNQPNNGQTNPGESSEPPNKSQNQVKSNKGDLSEIPMGLETEEDRFRTVMRAGQNNKIQENLNSQANLQPDDPALNAGLPRGTKLELMLDEPIRSGIATAVTGKLKKGVTNKRGEILIPKDSIIVVQFSAEVANGRVFNEKQAPIQIITPEGKSFEVNGMVKDAQGYAGLTGKITKVGGRSTLGKIGGVLGRVGGSLPGGQIITGTQQGIDGINSGGYVRDAAQIVEIPRGTSFLLIIGY